MTSVDLRENKKNFGVIWDIFESFKSWGGKISYAINLQHSLSFFGRQWEINCDKNLEILELLQSIKKEQVEIRDLFFDWFEIHGSEISKNLVHSISFYETWKGCENANKNKKLKCDFKMSLAPVWLHACLASIIWNLIEIVVNIQIANLPIYVSYSGTRIG